jgi:xanthine dehydrogenase accessory factor
VSIDVIRAASESAGGAALVTVVGTRGSVPRHAGSKMLVRRAGGIVGTVGGGRGEAAAIDAAAECISDGRSRTVTVEMQGVEASGPDMVCGGTGTLLVEVIRDRAPYEAARRALEAGRRVVMVKRFQGLSGGEPGSVSVAVLEESGAVPDRAGSGPFDLDPQAAEACMASGKPLLVEEKGLFYDPTFPREKMLILGGGHVGQVLASMASQLDFDVTVADDRADFTAAGRFPPGVKTVCGGYSDAVKTFAFDSATYVVIVTRGHLFDLECIRAVLGRTYRYAGFIGSARKAKLLRAQALSDGFDPARVEALRAPIGIDIAAETPAEIAVSILAQVVAVRRNATP